MDNVTHTLVGLMLSRTGLDRNPYTPVILIIAANVPDVDIVSGLRGSLNYLEYHRSYTHSLALAPLMAAIPPLLFVWKQRVSFRIYLLSLAAVLSHLMLDWTNAYGIRLLLPFSSRRLRLDITDIVDLWIFVLLILCVAAPALARLVTAEIGARTGSNPYRAWAWFGLLALLGYEGARYTAHERALAVMGAHLFNGAPARRLTALPHRFNPLQWRGIAEGQGFVVTVPVNLAEEFDPSAGRLDYSAPPDGPEIDAANRTPAFQVFGRFSQLPFWKLTPLPEVTRVELIDLRFGTPQSPGFEASAVVDAAGQVLQAQFGFGPPPISAR